jgi:hypothetical protein
MKQPHFLAVLLIAPALTFMGCKARQPSSDSAPGQSVAPAPSQSAAPANNGTLNSDGTVTPPGQQTGEQPVPGQSQAPAVPGGTGPQPAPPPAPVTLTAPVGTRVAIRTTETLSASRNDVGDGFTGVLNAPVVVNGATLFPRGAKVTGTVIAAKRRGRFKGSGDLGIELRTIAGVRVETNEYEHELKGKGKRTGGFIGGGAGLGALIGGIAGGGKGALIGGLAGAGAGTAGAAYTGNKDVVLPSESLVTFHLTAPLTVKQ